MLIILKSTSSSQLMDENLFYPKRITIASYPGGKSNRNKHHPLYMAVPKKIDYLIEPFAGLANFFLTISPRVTRVWLNDKDPEIYSLLLCMQELTLLQELIELIQSVEPIERADYYQWKQSSPSSLLELAARRLIILNCSPNGAGGGYSTEKAHRKWYQNKPKVWKSIHQIFQNKKTKITNIDYREVLQGLNELENQEDTFLYLDPPYHNVAKRGNLYGREYNQINLQKLKDELSVDSFPWILSNRDTPEVRSLFQKYHKLGYNTYNDMNNTRNKNPELLISNRPLK